MFERKSLERRIQVLIKILFRRMSLERRIQVSGGLICLGLIIEAVTLNWSHPTSFLVFIIAGGLCMGLGVLFYLYSLIRRNQPL